MGCPSEERLLEFVEGRMAAVSETLEAHLDQCSACREVVVAAASVEPDRDDGPGVAERYQVLGEIGRGGQSRVLRVFDRELAREVALKQFLSRGDAHSSQGPSPADRCLREVRVTGALSHPVILPIHDMGVRRSGAPYYTMPVVEGPTLAEVVAKAESLAERLRLLPHVVHVCQAIGYAHEHGFVHRDLKPDNIMVGAFGQTLLLDWGLARMPDGHEFATGETSVEADGVTLDGSVVGTPAYMSPEQAEGASVGPQSDVWSLGAVLYFVLYGRAPFEAPSVARTLELVRRGKLRTDEGEVPPELRAIVRRAMTVSREDRYFTATALANDLIAFQTGGRVTSYSYRRVERALRFAKRYKGLLITLSVVFASLATVAVVTGLSYRTEARARTQTHHALGEARAARAGAVKKSERHRKETIAANYKLAAAHIQMAERERDALHPLLAAEYARSALEHNPSYAQSEVFQRDNTDRQPEGEMITARARGQLALAAIDHIAGLTRVATPRPLNAALRSVGVGGDLVAVGGDRPEALIMGLADGREVAVLPGHRGNVQDVMLSQSGKYALTQDRSGTVRRWVVDGARVDRRWEGGINDGVMLVIADSGAVAFASDDRKLNVSSGDDVWATGLERPSALAITPDGARIAVGTGPGEVIVLDVLQRRVVGRRHIPATGVARILISADGSTVFATGVNAVVRLDVGSMRVTGRYLSAGTVVAIATSPGESHLYAATTAEIVAFELTSGRKVARLSTSVKPLHHVSLVGDRLIATNGTESEAWRVRTPDRASDRRSIFARSIQEGSRQFAPIDGDAGVLRVDWPDRTSRAISLGSGPPVVRLGLAGEFAVTRDRGRRVTTWRRSEDSWTELATRSFAPELAEGLAASAESGKAAVGLRNGEIWLWPVDGSGEDQLLEGHQGPVIQLAFSPDGSTLASATTTPGELFVWDVADIAAGPLRLTTDEDIFRHVAFGTDARVVYGAGDFGVKSWNVDGSPPHAFASEPHRRVAFENGILFAQARDFRFTVWDVAARMPALAVNSFGYRRAPAVSIEPGGGALRIIAYHDSYRVDLRRANDAG